MGRDAACRAAVNPARRRLCCWPYAVRARKVERGSVFASGRWPPCLPLPHTNKPCSPLVQRVPSSPPPRPRAACTAALCRACPAPLTNPTTASTHIIRRCGGVVEVREVQRRIQAPSGCTPGCQIHPGRLPWSLCTHTSPSPPRCRARKRCLRSAAAGCCDALAGCCDAAAASCNECAEALAACMFI